MTKSTLWTIWTKTKNKNYVGVDSKINATKDSDKPLTFLKLWDENKVFDFSHLCLSVARVCLSLGEKENNSDTSQNDDEDTAKQDKRQCVHAFFTFETALECKNSK